MITASRSRIWTSTAELSKQLNNISKAIELSHGYELFSKKYSHFYKYFLASWRCGLKMFIFFLFL